MKKRTYNLSTASFWRMNGTLQSKAIKLGEGVMPWDIRDLCERLKSFYRLSAQDKNAVVRSLYSGCGDFDMSSDELNYYQF